MTINYLKYVSFDNQLRGVNTYNIYITKFSIK